MNKEDIKKLIEGMDDDAQVIVINTPEQLEMVPKAVVQSCPRMTVGETVLVYWKKATNGVYKVATVWVFALALFPEIVPTPIRVVELTYEKMAPLVAKFDWSTPYSENVVLFPNLTYKGQIVLTDMFKPVSVVYTYPLSGFTSANIQDYTDIHPEAEDDLKV